MQEGKPAPCQDFCGTVSVGGMVHSKACHASAEKCYGWRAPGTPCRCSPGCRDAGRRLGDDPPVTSDPPPMPNCTCIMYCGRETHDGGCPQLAWSMKYHPLPPLPVTSGTDAVAAPAKPTEVAVGQRWRDGGAYTVTGVAAWAVTYDDGLVGDAESVDILRDEYLGTVPAPVSAPAGETAAPGAGELTIGEACAAAKGTVEWTWSGYNGRWEDWPGSMDRWSLDGLRQLLSAQFRRKAPRPSLVRGMVEEHFPATHWGTEIATLCAHVVKAMKEAVQRQALNGGSVSEWLDRAEAEMLKERP